jgi:hypothetical protein
MATNWSKGVAGGAQKYITGATNPRRLFNADPQGAQQSYVNGVNTAIANNRYATGLQNTDLNQMATNITSFGGARFAQAGTSKAAKFTAKSTALAAAIQSAQQSIANMPRVTPQDRIARSQAFQTAMLAFKGKI